MPRRRSNAHLTTDLIKLAQVLGQAWSGAKAIERRYPRVFAAAVADALQLDEDEGTSFVDSMEREHVGIENSKRRSPYQR